MKKNLLFFSAMAVPFFANAQITCQTKQNAPLKPQTYVATGNKFVELNGNGIVKSSVTRSTCSDKIKYVDRSGTPPAGNQIYLGGTVGWNELFQVYPGFTGQITRIDFQGGNWGSTETVTLKVHPVSSGAPSLAVLGSVTVNVTSASGEFGANFSSPINVTGGFAVSVAKPAAATDSIFVYYMDEFVGDDFAYLYNGSSMYSARMDYSSDIDMMIRPTIQFSLGAPTLSASPTSLCEGSSSYIDIVSYPTLPWSSSYWNIYNPDGFSGSSANFGDASTGTLPSSHTYNTAGSITASATVTYDGWTSNCTSDAGTASITVNPDPVANFSWSSTNLAVTFTNLSTGATTYNWLFGDGGNAT
ncbi:MAG TPA: hypothetical protein VD905_00945, partial [Flavobacteriales bacterium]|nr:hypothetical protein [Flavobacteriales bacterium]